MPSPSFRTLSRADRVRRLAPGSNGGRCRRLVSGWIREEQIERRRRAKGRFAEVQLVLERGRGSGTWPSVSLRGGRRLRVAAGVEAAESGPPSARSSEDARLQGTIRAFHVASHGTYGARRILSGRPRRLGLSRLSVTSSPDSANTSRRVIASRLSMIDDVHVSRERLAAAYAPPATPLAGSSDTSAGDRRWMRPSSGRRCARGPHERLCRGEQGVRGEPGAGQRGERGCERNRPGRRVRRQGEGKGRACVDVTIGPTRRAEALALGCKSGGTAFGGSNPSPPTTPRQSGPEARTAGG